jgi:hypothetical protein
MNEPDFFNSSVEVALSQCCPYMCFLRTHACIVPDAIDTIDNLRQQISGKINREKMNFALHYLSLRLLSRKAPDSGQNRWEVDIKSSLDKNPKFVCKQAFCNVFEISLRSFARLVVDVQDGKQLHTIDSSKRVQQHHIMS